jgi:hypothetical protein
MCINSYQHVYKRVYKHTRTNMGLREDPWRFREDFREVPFLHTLGSGTLFQPSYVSVYIYIYIYI